LNDIGWCQSQLGEHRDPLESCRDALDLFQQLGNKDGEASAWDSLGYVQHQLGDLDEAARCFQHSVDPFRTLGDLPSATAALSHLGDARRAAGDPQAAWRAWRAAIAIYEGLNPAAANQLSQKLDHDRRAPR